MTIQGSIMSERGVLLIKSIKLTKQSCGKVYFIFWKIEHNIGFESLKYL